MYNKIFTKILDSSVWLEPTSTRIVWLTMIASMDETGFCPFAAPGNVASRARVTDAEARAALQVLENPDRDSSDPENEGRRIERVPGGWIVLNAPKYRDIVTRANSQEKTKERVRRFREKKRFGNVHVTPEKRSDVSGNDLVTPSEALSDTYTETEKTKPSRKRAANSDERHTQFKQAVQSYWNSKNKGVDMPWGPAEGKQLGMFLREAPHITLEQFTGFLRARFKSDVNHGDRPCQWLKWVTTYGNGPIDRFNKPISENGHVKVSPGELREQQRQATFAEAARVLAAGKSSGTSGG